MKSVHLKKIHHDYSETQTESDGINMIKDFLAIHFEMIGTIYDPSESNMVTNPSTLADEQFYCDITLHVFNIASDLLLLWHIIQGG